MQNKPTKATINEQFKLDLTQPNGLDFVKVDDASYHVISDNKTYRVQVLDTDFTTKTFKFKVDGSTYSVVLEDRYDELIKSLGLQVNNNVKVSDIKAPMPGLVLQINIKEGQAIEKDDALLILEAMKMENVIKAPGPATIKAIKIKQGDAVEKNQVLIELD